MAFSLGSFVVRFAANTTEFDKAVNGVHKSNQNLASSFKTLGGVAAGIFSFEIAKGLLLTADRMSVLERRVKALSSSAKEGTFFFQEMVRVASDVGVSVDGITQIFQRFLLMQDEIGATNNELVTMTETLSMMGVIGGATTQEITNALIQLSQGLASGALRGEELRSVMEQMPLVSRAIAKELGVSVGHIKELAAEGAITSEVVMKAILNQATEVKDMFETLPKSMGQNFNTLKAEFSDLIKEMDQEMGTSQFFGALLQRMARGASNIRQNLFADPDEIDDLGIAYDRFAAIVEMMDQLAKSRDVHLKLMTEDDVVNNTTRYQSVQYYNERINELMTERLALSARIAKLGGEQKEMVTDEEKSARGKADADAKAHSELLKQVKAYEDIWDELFNINMEIENAIEGEKRLQDQAQKLADLLERQQDDLSSPITREYTSTWEYANVLAEEAAEAIEKTTAQAERLRQINEKYGRDDGIPEWLREINKLQREGRETWERLANEQSSDLDEIIKKYQEMANAWKSALADMQSAAGNFGSYLEKEREKELDAFKDAENKKLESVIDSIENNRRMTSDQKREAIEAAKEQSEAIIDAKDKETRKRAAAEKALFITEQAIAVSRILINTAVETSKVLSNPVLAGFVAASGAALAISTAALGYQEYKSTYGTSDINGQANISGATPSATQSGNSGRSLDVVVNNNVGANVTATQTPNGSLQLDIDAVDSAIAQGIMSNTSRTSQAINNSFNTSRRLG